MSDTPEARLQGNRFEAMYQRWRQRSGGRRRWPSWLGGFLLLALVIEIAALAFVFTWYAGTGKLGYSYVDKFLLTRWFVAPFIEGNPARNLPGTHYIGTQTSQCMAAQWHQADSLLGWRIRPGISYLKQPNRVFDSIGWRMSNAQGFAAAGATDFRVERQKQANTFRILVLGASSVEGDGAETPLDNLPSKLHAEMSADVQSGGARIEVVNGGVGGYRISQEYLYLLSELIEYQPDLIVSYSGFVDLAYARIEQDMSGTAMEPFRTARHRLNSLQLDQGQTAGGAFAQLAGALMLETRCLVDDLGITFLMGKAFERAGYVPSALSRTAKADDAVILETALRAYRQGVVAISDLARRRGVKLAVALQPTLGVGEKPLVPLEREMLDGLGPREVNLRRTYYQHAWAMLGSLAGDGGFCAIDLSQAFADTDRRVWEDSRHLLGAGNAVVASKLLEGLSRCRLMAPIGR